MFLPASSPEKCLEKFIKARAKELSGVLNCFSSKQS